MAYVREVPVKLGDRVREGDVLIVVDAKDLEARERAAEAARVQAQTAIAANDQAIESARAGLDLAEATYRRMKDLYDKRSISSQEFDEVTARRRQAQAALEMASARRKEIDAAIARADEDLLSARIQTSYTVLAAPFAGIVTTKNVEPGNLAVPGAALLTIEPQSGYRLEAVIEESNLPKLKIGQKTTIALDSLPQPLNGVVAEIVPAVDPSSRSFIAKIDLPASGQLRSGLFGRARFTLGTRRALSVPAAAVIQRGQMTWVYIADSGVARSRLVTLGERSGGTFEALSGIDSGELVISPVPANLTDGTRVEVKP
jgi:RND family efflux transporter MFP subunit